MSLIQAGDTPIEAIMKVAKRNIGAVSVLTRMIKEAESIDPDALLGAIAPIFALDTNGIYGESVWILYKDGCGENLTMMIAALRAVQLGLITQFDLYSAANKSPKVVPIRADIVEVVQAQLPRFGKKEGGL